jgi:signal transduction histidine kinase
LKILKYVFLALAFLFQLNHLIGQKNSSYYLKAINKFNSKFSQNIVTDLILDKYKTLWIATPTSLFQYNGCEVKQIESPNNKRTVCFYKNTDNQIIILYSDGKSYLLEKNKISFYFQDTTQIDFTWNYPFLGVPQKYLNDLFYNPQIRASYFFSKVNFLNANEIIFSTKVKEDQSKIVQYNFKSKHQEILFESKPQEDIEYLNVQTAWFKIDENGKILPAYNPLNISIEQPPILLTKQTKYRLFNKPLEMPILISGNNIWVLTNKDKHFYWQLVYDEISPEISIQNARYSPELDKILLATESDGFLILSKKIFNTITNKNKLFKSNYYLQIPLKDGNILTNGGAVDNSKEHNKLFANQNLNNNYKYLNENEFIGSTSKNIITYNTKSKKVKIIKSTNENEHPNFIHFKDTFFIIGNKNIYTYNHQSKKITTIFTGSIGYSNITELKIINQKIWIGSLSGISIFNPISRKIERKILENIPIRSISTIEKNYYLNTYGNGIFKIDTIKLAFKNLPTDYNHSILYSHCIIEDKHSNLWISTNLGLLRFNKKSFINSVNKNQFIPEPEYFDTEDGLITDEFNGAASPPYLKFGDSLISLPSIKGIVQFNPITTKNANQIYQFNIETISYINRNIPFEKNQYNLTSNIEEITLDIDLIFWGNLKNLNLYYEIDGNIKMLDYHDIHQLKIPINHYNNSTINFFTFDHFGRRKNITDIKLYREYPWYLKIEFILLSFLIIYLISFFISRIRTNRINKRNTELEKLIQDKTKEIQDINIQLLSKVNQLTELNNANTTYISVINHDIFAPIKYINIIGDKISQNSTKINKTDIVNQFNQIINSTKRLEVLCSNILNYINSNNTLESSETPINLYVLIEELRQFLNIGLEINNNKITNTIPSNITIQSNKDALNIVFTNLLSNANRFTKNGVIGIQFLENQTEYIITVIDNGKGMTLETLSKIKNKTITVAHRNNLEYESYGIGYSLIYKMLDFINAKFEITSEINSGTEVKIIIPK